MRYASIRKMDIVNGIGISCSLFVQGCSHRCQKCFNIETWNFNGGKEWTEEIEDKFIQLCQKPFVDCVSILGGEPFDQGYNITLLLRRLRKEVNKPIFIWSGYTYEQLRYTEFAECIEDKLFDYLIDGEYVDKLKDCTLPLRGSSNQRIIDIKQTVEQGKVVLFNP